MYKLPAVFFLSVNGDVVCPWWVSSCLPVIKWSLWNGLVSLQQPCVQQTADGKVTGSHRFVSIQRGFQTMFPWGSIKGHRCNLEHLCVIHPQSDWLESRGHSAFRRRTRRLPREPWLGLRFRVYVLIVRQHPVRLVLPSTSVPHSAHLWLTKRVKSSA